MEIDGKVDKNWNIKQRVNFYKKQKRGAIRNRLIFDYLSILQDDKSYALSRRPIDAIVSRLKNDVVKKIDKAKGSYRRGMYELLPSYQSDKKLEFKTGKDGISPFALNAVHLTLT